MSRRFARVGRFRRPGGGGGGAAGGGVPQFPPLPTSVTPIWEFHSERALLVASWTDTRVSGIVLAGQGTPVVSADTGFFRGRQVAQTINVGAHHWANRALGTIAATGTLPWYYVVGRFRSVPPVNQNLTGMGRAATADNMTLRHNVAGNVRDVFMNGITVANGLGDQAVHRWHTCKDGVNANLSIDGVNATTATATTLTHDVNALAAGSAANAAGNTADASLAYWFGASARPTPAEIAALDAWALAYWF